ncbi:MAG: AAA family ATPase [Candidatus Binataceae bacterium]|jgi:hypothetical protein
MNAAETLKADPVEIRRALDLLCEHGAVHELRALDTSKGTVSGYFDNLDEMTANAAGCSDRFQAGGVYLSLNCVNPDLLARSSNGVKTFAKHTSGDANIVARRWLLIDLDPIRPSGISATDIEHKAALERAMGVREMLADFGWPSPIYADSGNGAHLLYRIELRNDADSLALLKRVLAALDSLFTDEAVAIDRTTYNAARISKLYGSISRKGDSTADRPHRLSRILETPTIPQIVTLEQLDKVAHLLPQPEPPARRDSTAQSSFNLENWIAERGIEVTRESTWSGGRRWILSRCLFDPSHGGSGAAILQLSSGAIVYRCLHNSCADRKWADVRERFEPGYRDRGASALVRNGKQMPAATASTSQTAEIGVTTRLSDVEPEEVEWLWRDRLALGKLNLLVGDPGNGKSFVTLDTAARVSTGAEFPDGSPCVRGSVILITGEDGIADTVRPRLDAQGSDLTKIHQLKIKSGDIERQFDIGAHLDQLREKIREFRDVRLLIIDPLTAYLGDVDSNKDSRVRGLLTPFATLAEETRVAILAVMHLNKAAVMDAIYRVTGSVAFIAQARSAWAVLPDPQDSSRRLFLKLKTNLAPADIPGLAFTIAANDHGRPVLAWSNEPVNVNLRDVMGGFSNTRRGPKPNKLEAANALISEMLADGQEHPSAELDEAADAARITLATMKSARKALGVRAWKREFDGAWMVSLPADRKGGNPNSSPSPTKNSNSSAKSLWEKHFTNSQNSNSSAENTKSQSLLGDKNFEDLE